MMGKLPDGHDDAKDDCAVSEGLENAAAFFFRANEESVSRFLMVVHKSLLVAAAPYAARVPRRLYNP